jgi:hypothetical protein
MLSDYIINEIGINSTKQKLQHDIQLKILCYGS